MITTKYSTDMRIARIPLSEIKISTGVEIEVGSDNHVRQVSGIGRSTCI